jgi:hypothetical protein
MSQIFEKSETEMQFQRRVTENTVLRKATAEQTRVLQAFQKAFTPLGTTTFKPRPIQLYRLKIDCQETPDDLVESWLGFLTDNKLDRKTWPFIRWWIEKLIIPQSQEDWEMQEIYKGVFSEPTPNVANAAGANVNGIKKQINDWIDDGDITPIVTGALSEDPETFVDQVEDFYKSIPKKYQTNVKSICISRDNKTKFKEGMRAKYNVNWNQVGDLVKLIDYDVMVKGLASMDGSDKLIATFPFNMAAGIKAPENENVFQVENVDRTVKIYTDFWKGIGFWVPEWIFTNDQDLSSASS